MLQPRTLRDFDIELACTSLKVEKISIVTDSDPKINNLPIEKDWLYTKMTKEAFTVYWAQGTTPARNDNHAEKLYIDFPTLVHYPFDYHFTVVLNRVSLSVVFIVCSYHTLQLSRSLIFV